MDWDEFLGVVGAVACLVGALVFAAAVFWTVGA